ncbi:MAG: hypothetical protein K2X66_12760 [Cyanobacteria bacterium]|nr:hypothetical protein [Cyanobacteriota bacterium]
MSKDIFQTNIKESLELDSLIFEESPQDNDSQERYSGTLLPAQNAHESLQSYVSKRIFDTREAPVPIEEANPHLLLQQGPTKNRLEASSEIQSPDENTINGNQLNSLDTQLSAGLERYLPTPSIRLRIIKDRLAQEIQKLESDLQKYQSLKNPPADISQKIEGLSNRLALLKKHDSQIDQELNSLFVVKGSAVFVMTKSWMDFKDTVSQQTQKMTEKISPSYFLKKLNPEQYEMNRLNKELQGLTEVLGEHLTKQAPSSVELGTLINQYDQTVHQVEQLADHFRNKKSWRERWSDAMNRFFRKIYS